MELTDMVERPRHYIGNGIECMEAMRSMMHEAPATPMQSFWWGASFKYVWRWPWKNGAQDIRKAIRCLEYLLEEVEDGGA